MHKHIDENGHKTDEEGGPNHVCGQKTPLTALERLWWGIEHRGDDWPDLMQLAETAGLSLFGLNRVFRKNTGLAPLAYARAKRLNGAAILLCRTHKTILDIALTSGYQSQQAFTRAFSREYDLSPAQFRVKFREDIYHAPPIPDLVRAVQVMNLPAQHLLGRRYLGNYADVPAHWLDFSWHLRMADIDPAGLTYMGLLHDDPYLTPPGHIRYDCAFLLPEHRSITPRSLTCVPITLTGGRYAALDQHGPYIERIAQTIATLVTQWLPATSHQLALVPAFERFHHAPWAIPSDAWALTAHVGLI
ncbi:AraC family transcriptional regulator [Acidithiobacillus ferrivorans]|uniref:Helix-turn-helix domain-containing protein n=1 Tax=Acidithiobacillus ferrivorans TaxID=160808 RepID=A0A7T4WFG5_9PROT|nr:helix-turn-helix domain-containing protein [Acidithiobacillus ferrivorans]QQD73633.1 helix-turn-helix domain-containing protein [Acidithiobacillus ferrivorans]